MTIDKRLPALRNLRQQLQDDASALRRSVIANTAQGKDATGYVLQQHELEAQIQELDCVIEDYAERAHNNDNKVEITRHTLVAATFLYLLLMIPILYLLFAAK